MNVIVIGATGTLGSEVLPLLHENPQIERIRAFSRSEHKQAELAEKLQSNKTDFLLGDIRDAWRVKWALQDSQQVYHFAATKRVEAASYNPREAKTVNIDGSENIIQAILDTPTVEKAIFTSTDKACAPVNFYGATKMVAEQYWIAANIGNHRSRFSACRYGNVMGSQGSVVALWKKQLAAGRPLSVTDGEMTRFFITPKQAARFVVNAMREMDGGETYVPVMKSTTLRELADAFRKAHKQPEYPLETIPCRPGEKVHEVLISHDQVPLTTFDGKKLIQWPADNLYPVKRVGEPVKEEFTSLNAERFTEGELMELVL